MNANWNVYNLNHLTVTLLFGSREIYIIMNLSLLRRKAISFLKRPPFQQCWFLPAWILLGISKALVFTIPFKRLAPKLGYPAGAIQWIPIITQQQHARALQIGRVIKMAAIYTPWDSNCFPQAVTARLLLGLYGIPYTMFFGLASDPKTKEMKAHAWVASGGISVTGGVSFQQFTVVGSFVAPQLVQVFQR